MAAKVNIPRETTVKRIADSLDTGSPDLLDGTKTGYKKAMRKWFLQNGAASADSATLTALVDEWYEITRDDWCGYTEFYQPDVSAVTYGTKGGDNADLTCTPATDTTEGQDDYAGLPLFACVDCNFEVDAETLRPVITAIDGITPGFKRKDSSVYVGVLQMAGYMFFKEDSDTYTIGYAANRDIPYADVEPLPDAVQPDDNSVRAWVVHAKYMSHTVDSKLTSYAGVIPTAWLSHNTTHTLSKANGSQYSGSTTADDLFLKLMMFIKYGSLTMDGIIQGCLSNNYQYPAQVAETGVKRVLISTSNSLEVGMGVLIGDYTSSADRGNSGMYGTTGQAGAIITKIETVTISETTTDEETEEETTTETEYCAVYVDVDESFDTGANGAATAGTTYISTFHWPTGTTDCVLGNDGSPTSNTSGKYPGKIQGIEIMNGAYEILADVIWSLYQNADDETYYYEAYIVRKSAAQSTAITDDYEATGLTCEQPASAGWQYIKKLGYALGVFAPIETGGSSSTYTRDAFYMNAATTGTREWLARGTLDLGSAYGGLSFVHGGHALSNAYWHFASRLSAGGNRGEWAA